MSAPATYGAGLHDGIPAAIYHADPCPQPSLSSGVLRTILEKSIEHGALEHRRLGGQSRESTPSMNLGSIVHALLAGESSDLVLGDFDSFRTKAAQDWRRSVEAVGKIPVLERDVEAARPVVEAVREKAGIGIDNKPFAAHGRSEVSAIWQDGETWCRARYDRLVIDPEGYADIWDWKTCADISERAIARSVASMGYYVQAMFYLRGLETLLPEYRRRTSFIFCFVEATPPYHVRRVTLAPSFQEAGRRKVEEGLAIWRDAVAKNTFAAAPFETLQLEAPAWLDEDDEITISTE